MKIFHLNVCGLTKSNNEFRCAMIKQIDAYIYSINETHLNQNEIIEVESYKWIGFNRCRIHKDDPKTSGGVGILIKHSVLDKYLLELINKSYDRILAIKFTSKDTDYSCVVISEYLLPRTPYGVEIPRNFSLMPYPLVI